MGIEAKIIDKFIAAAEASEGIAMPQYMRRRAEKMLRDNFKRNGAVPAPDEWRCPVCDIGVGVTVANLITVCANSHTDMSIIFNAIPEDNPQ